MGTHIRAPAVGWATQSSVYRWWQDDGDWVTPGTPICTLSAGTLLHTIFALESGFVRIPFPEVRQVGTTVRRGTPLGFILGPGESARDLTADVPSLPDVPDKSRVAWDGQLYEAARRAAAGKVAASPRARQKARQLAVSLADLAGSGHTGAIREKDVAAAGPNAAAGRAQRHVAAIEVELPLPADLRADPDAWLRWILGYLNEKLEWKYRNQPGAVARWQERALAWSYFDRISSALRNVPALHHEAKHPAPWQWATLHWAILDLTGSPFRRFVPPIFHEPTFLIVLTGGRHIGPELAPAKLTVPENMEPVVVSVFYDWNIVPVPFWSDLLLELEKHCRRIG